MIQSPPRRSANVAVIVLLGFIVSSVVEFSADLLLDYTTVIHSASEADVVTILLSVVLGALTGGVMFFGRPRHHGLAAVAGLSAFVAGVLADEAANVVFFTLKHLPVDASLITGYFTHSRPAFWLGNALGVAVAAGLTALRVGRVRAADRRSGTYGGAYGAPPQWAPPPPYGMSPGPFGPGAYGPGPGAGPGPGQGPGPQGPHSYGPPPG